MATNAARLILYGAAYQVRTYPKDFDIILNEKGVQEALKQLHDGIIEGLPKKRLDDETDTRLAHMSAGYDQALDDVTKFLNNYFGQTS